MEKFDHWLDQINDAYDEFAYRAIYSAYLDASGGFESRSPESSSRRHPDGSFEIRAGRETIVLADDAEREALAAHMVKRYCGERYSSMRMWEQGRHTSYLDDRDNWTSVGSWYSDGPSAEAGTWWSRLVDRLRRR